MNENSQGIDPESIADHETGIDQFVHDRLLEIPEALKSGRQQTLPLIFILIAPTIAHTLFPHPSQDISKGFLEKCLNRESLK